jgi:tRNA1Val (adenine37-N6)-methyltransferase
MDYLTADIKIEQNENGYHFTSDAINLGNFVTAKQSDTIIDAGCGSGVLSLLLASKFHPKKIIAVDINKDAAILAAKNVTLNNLTNCEVINADIRTLHNLTANDIRCSDRAVIVNANTADIIVCNPPYFTSGKQPKNPIKSLARHSETLSLNELALAATRLLKFGGRIYFCYPANKTAEAVTIFENNNFRIKELKFITNDNGVYLTLFKCKKGGGHSTKITL